jgi:hypothetical protein
MDAMKGTARPATPTAPTAEVAPIRKRRLLVSTPSVLIKFLPLWMKNTAMPVYNITVIFLNSFSIMPLLFRKIRMY